MNGFLIKEQVKPQNGGECGMKKRCGSFYRKLIIFVLMLLLCEWL